MSELHPERDSERDFRNALERAALERLDELRDADPTHPDFPSTGSPSAPGQPRP